MRRIEFHVRTAADADTRIQPRASPGVPSRSASSQESALDKALDEALSSPSRSGPSAEVPLKRQWDDALEAELEAALSGFDPKTFDVARTRPPKTATDRAQVDKRDRGQEARKGLRVGKVIVARGRSLFVDLGGKSEGVIPLDQFEGEIPAPGSEIEVIVDHFDASEGIQHLRLEGDRG